MQPLFYIMTKEECPRIAAVVGFTTIEINDGGKVEQPERCELDRGIRYKSDAFIAVTEKREFIVVAIGECTHYCFDAKHTPAHYGMLELDGPPVAREET